MVEHLNGVSIVSAYLCIMNVVAIVPAIAAGVRNAKKTMKLSQNQNIRICAIQNSRICLQI
jgi:hypothetical protein